MKTLLQLQTAAQNFAAYYKDQTDERREKDTFWNEFFAIFGIDRKNVAHFEYPVKDPADNTQFVDIFWEGIFLAEHKSANKNLTKAKEQAERYLQEIGRTKPSALPEYYAVSDFAHFHLYRRVPEEGTENQWQFPLEELPEYITRGVFDFMFGIEAKVRQIQEEANIQAAAAIGRLHDALKEEGIYEEHELRLFITRLLFLFFADDSAVFQRNYLFQDFLESCKEADTLGDKLNQLFEFLNTPDQKRSKTQSEKFKGFEYVNGGLFKERLRTFDFTAKQHRALIDCGNFDWRNISPEIFGTLFQSVMDAQERREAGAHYTEAANIDKVINGLFLENLRAEFEAVKALKRDKAKKLAAFYQKIQNLQFLDPACGCGNFLIVAYDRIRALEDDIIAEALKDKAGGLFDSPSVQCRLKQFHGIEIDEFAVLIARTAMWLKNHQCNIRTQIRFDGEVACHTLPLEDAAEIIHANSLRTPWQAADYIFGNPPFIGSTYQTKEQKNDLESICGHIKGYGLLDYVCNWYVKAAGIMAQNPQVQTAFVSTNSICQGQQVEILWGSLLNQGIEIHFAHRTFQWTSQAAGKAAVHCIIVGFRQKPQMPSEKTLYDYPDIKGEPVKHTAANINPYLIDAPDLIIAKRRSQISGEIEMLYGNKPTDGGNLILSTAEKDALIAAEPLAEQYTRPFVGAEEFINGKTRWCLWFHGVPDVKRNHDLKQMPQVQARIQAVKAMREASSDKQTQKDAATPWLFQKVRQPSDGNFLIIPRVSSESRRFIPIGYLSFETVVSDLVFTLPNATLYHFGILSSTMHNAFMRTVAGRLKSDYRYSNTVVYNNFPFPESCRMPSENDRPDPTRAAVEAAAQAVLDARGQYRREAREAGLPEPTLAELYAPDAGYTALDKAHAALDKAVDKAYGYKTGKNTDDEAERTAFLFDLYRKAIESENTKPPKKSK
ncbi:class I SAM-dependent DNA methyltransferase [Neisseria flavescens]|uniref:class I SAM-dependent DNA methyltransferase n=1 Tax=Neisseria flavescens TaxID=484 RepID=UPI000D8ADD80|nr:class I SAM-dependent DNA methyltransferase [Neisseria flavescens]QCL68724.1 class I SAM-dependent DNA methyltransferase [Neisseria flavescens]SPY09429.1 Type I restriction-modification system methyltransferase subunit [Neisseria meningitidis]STZ65295.1 Type I restriction-modification system methyltransferase subunit [Neisseria flavescens]